MARGAEEGLEGQPLLEVGLKAPRGFDCKRPDPAIDLDRELEEALDVLELARFDVDGSFIGFEVAFVDGSLEDDRRQPVVGSAQDIEIRGRNIGSDRVRHSSVGERIESQGSVVGLDPVSAIDRSIGRRHRPGGVGRRQPVHLQRQDCDLLDDR